LWRPSADATVQLTIAPPTGPAQTIAWPRGQQTLAWPAAIPISNGASYQLSWTGEATPRRLTLRSLAAMPAGDAAAASALLANECTNQLNVFIAQREMRAASAAPSGGAAR
jgi:hypothetical protein